MLKRIIGYFIVSVTLALGGMWVAAKVNLNTFQAGDLIDAGEVNANFEALRDAVVNLVASINGKHGAVTLEAGSNVTIDDTQDGKIVISAAATGSNESPTTINGQQGDVTLEAGSNVTIGSSQAGTIVISAAGGTVGGAGDITEVVAGDGLTGGGTTGAVTLGASDALARDSEILPTVLANDGPGSALDADTLDGLDSTDFVGSSDIMPTVLANDGAGSTLDADTLDGLDSTDLASSDHTHSGLPKGFGRIGMDGAIQGGSGNFTSTWVDTCGCYQIRFPGSSFDLYYSAVLVTPVQMGTYLDTWRTSALQSLLVVSFSRGSTEVQSEFSFVVY